MVCYDKHAYLPPSSPSLKQHLAMCSCFSSAYMPFLQRGWRHAANALRRRNVIAPGAARRSLIARRRRNGDALARSLAPPRHRWRWRLPLFGVVLAAAFQLICWRRMDIYSFVPLPRGLSNTGDSSICRIRRRIALLSILLLHICFIVNAGATAAAKQRTARQNIAAFWFPGFGRRSVAASAGFTGKHLSRAHGCRRTLNLCISSATSGTEDAAWRTTKGGRRRGRRTAGATGSSPIIYSSSLHRLLPRAICSAEY